MPLQIEYFSLNAAGVRSKLGGVKLPVSATATLPGSQVTTPDVDGLEISLRSDVWAAVDIAASPAPGGTASSIVIVGPGQPQIVKGRRALKIGAIITNSPNDLSVLGDAAFKDIEVAGGVAGYDQTLAALNSKANSSDVKAGELDALNVKGDGSIDGLFSVDRIRATKRRTGYRNGSKWVYTFRDNAKKLAAAFDSKGRMFVHRLLHIPQKLYRNGNKWVYRIADAAGKVAFAIDKSGRVYIYRLLMPGPAKLYRNRYKYVYSIRDKFKRIAFGIDQEGRTTLRLSKAALAALAADLGIIGGSVVPSGWRGLVTGESLSKITPSADGTYQFGVLREADQRPLIAIQLASALAAATAPVYSASPMSGVLHYGQSNAGKGDSADPADQTVSVFPHNVLTFNGGLASGTDVAVSPADLASLIPQVDDSGATWQAVCTANAIEGLARLFDAVTGGVFSWTVWKGSTALTNFIRGTVGWDNIMAGIDAMPAAAASYLRTVTLDVIIFVQGESGPGSATSVALSRQTYGGYVTPELYGSPPVSKSFYLDLRDEAALHGPKTKPLIFVAQVNRAVADSIPPGVALAQWDAARLYRDQGVVMPGPMYQCPIAIGSGVHPGDVGRMVFGDLCALVKSITDTGETFNPLWPKLTGTAYAANMITRTTNVLKLKLDLPNGGGPIAFDTSWVPAVANMGFVYVDDSSGVTIQSVAISGVDEVTITLTGDPGAAANKRLQYAQDVPEFVRDQATQIGWSKGRGNLVSPSGVPSFYYSKGYAVPPVINHYCIRFEVNVP